VPTGRIFIQARTAKDLAKLIAPLGYVIESVPPYTPYAAWIAARRGSIAAALVQLEALIAPEKVDSTEP
jgi:hypothetical protein